MSDVNLLPEDLRAKEEKERSKSSGGGVIPMSSPVSDSGGVRKTLHSLTQSVSKVEEDAPMKRLREESYISIDRSGKMVPGKDTDNEKDPVVRGPSWGKRFFSRFNTPKAPHPHPSLEPRVRAETQKGIEDFAPRVSSPVPSRPPNAPMTREKTAAFPAEDKKESEKPATPPLPSVPKGMLTGAAGARPAPLGFEKSSRSNSGAAQKPERGMNTPTDAGPIGPSQFGVNLLPGGEWQVDFSPTTRLHILFALCLLVVISIVGSFGGRAWYLSRQAAKAALLQDEIDATNAEANSLSDEDAAWRSLRAQLSTLQQVLAGHVNLKPAFIALEASIIPEVQVTALDIASNGSLVVAGKTLSLELVARQMKAFEALALQPSKVDLTTYAVAADGSVTFSLTITFPPSALTYAGQ